ncbi:MAG: putative peptidoglycan glycosyltransferase FtsW [Rickettsiaceae bacterium]
MNHANYFYIRNWYRSIDQQIIVAFLILFGFSMLLVSTSSPIIAFKLGLPSGYFIFRQSIYLSIAAVIIIALSSMNKQYIRRVAILGLFAGIILLILVKFYGYEAKGAKRWISILGISLQPSEFIKPFFLVVSAWILSLGFQNNKANFIPCFSLYLIIAVLLITQPDIGNLIMLTAVFAIQIFIAGFPMLWMIIAFIAGIISIFCTYLYIPHVADRINKFLDTDITQNYQVNKSINAFANGGLYGTGPGEGVIKQSLPDLHSDFIFAVAGEEFGTMFCLIIILVFAFIIIKALIMVLNENDKFVQFTIVGITSQFGLQALINIGVTLNLLPTKGITLPFISYGGSSIFATSISSGIILSFTKKRIHYSNYQIQDIDICGR